MQTFLSAFLPDSLGILPALLLIAVSVVTSALTAALGLGGGIAMLAALGLALPVPALIPVHGVVQLGSNAGRALLQRRHAEWRLIWPFLVGSVIGAALGARFVVALPEALLKTGLGLFILVMIWTKLPAMKLGAQRLLFGFVGLFSTFLTMFFGATGPFVAAFVGPALSNRMQVIGTHAVIMTAQHLFKVVAFVAVGFAFAEWLPFLVAMVVAGFIGTALGTRILKGLKEEKFRLGFRLVVSLLALDLLRRGVVLLLA
ncbi:putative membrane protein YfcA [Rhodopseudomonas julia]|uniref:Probable membrane transporter protein n=1 Tax=Rhodopseudomonas julia TaxID=200617 RepID=A0ABU0C6L8_9BRAD|nr:sulfite exporter TauE/SafE family protein [Rhodopseudomonas julia]MDQ0324727.1 putative membrane protein YfcA [Rhodopseudomonas julia]